MFVQYGWNISNRTNIYFDGLVQERRHTIANALELRLSCINPSIWATTVELDLLAYDIQLWWIMHRSWMWIPQKGPN